MNAAAPSRVFVGLGANLGDARATLEAAQLCALRAPGPDASARLPRLLALPHGAGRRRAGPDFLNRRRRASRPRSRRTRCSPALHAIEHRFGRERQLYRRNAPRTLDLDLLLYGVDPAPAAAATLADARLDAAASPHAAARLRARAAGRALARRRSIIRARGGVARAARGGARRGRAAHRAPARLSRKRLPYVGGFPMGTIVSV